jgi:5-hydroxyisourate hydrolase-like protein (transthyretin family)
MRTIASASALLLGLLAAGCNGEVVSGGGAPAKMVVVSGDLQTATVGTELAQPLVVRVVDEGDRPVRNQLVNFRVTRGGGSVFAGSAITNRDGIAQERWTLGTVADTQQVEARAVDATTGAAVVFATFRAVGLAGAAASIAPVQSTLAGMPGAAAADSAAALVRDAHGNPVPGVAVTWAVTAGGGSVSPATSTTNAQGIARAQWTLGGTVAAPQTLRASAGASMNATFTATAAVGAGATLTVVSGGGQTSPVFGEFAQPLVVEVRQNGIPVEGAQVQWTTGAGSFSDVPTTTTVTDAQGRASARWKAGGQAGTQTATATLMGASVSFTGTVTPGAPTFIFSTTPLPATVAAGTVSQQKWRVLDRIGGNPVPGVEVQFTTTYGTVSPATATTDADGHVTTTWTFPTLIGGPESQTATLRGFVAQTAASAEIRTAARAVPTKLLISGGDAFTLAMGEGTVLNATLEDDYGNLAPTRGSGAPCTVTWSAPAGVELVTLFGIEFPRARVRGVTPGTYTITATCPPLGFVDTITVTVQ